VLTLVADGRTTAAAAATPAATPAAASLGLRPISLGTRSTLARNEGSDGLDPMTVRRNDESGIVCCRIAERYDNRCLVARLDLIGCVGLGDG
jgi:hypothetical protein